DDPLAFGKAARDVADALVQIGNAAYAVERVKLLLKPFAIHMGVTVDQPRNNGLAFEVETFGRGIRLRQQFVAVADGEDTIAADSDRLGDSIPGVKRDDFCVMQDQRRAAHAPSTRASRRASAAPTNTPPSMISITSAEPKKGDSPLTRCVTTPAASSATREDCGMASSIRILPSRSNVQRGAVIASASGRPCTRRFTNTCDKVMVCPGPPGVPSRKRGLPPLSTMAGLSVWAGRLPGATALTWPRSSEKPRIRLLKITPVTGSRTKLPNSVNTLCTMVLALTDAATTETT